MNRTSLPQSVIVIWVSYDDVAPARRRFVIVEKVTETDGATIRWPKVIAAGQATGRDFRCLCQSQH